VPKSYVQVSVYFEDLFSNVVENSNAVNFKSDRVPSLHNCPTEMSELFAMAGKTCATAASALKSRMSNDDVWSESIVDPFGYLTRKGLIDFFLLRQVALINNECSLQTESTITVY
jgi:hypothetical protein